MIEYGVGDENPKISKITVEYNQCGDCCESEDDIQTIILETMDNGVAPFIRISIPNNGHWSISGINDLIKLVKDFEKKVNYHEEN